MNYQGGSLLVASLENRLGKFVPAAASRRVLISLVDERVVFEFIRCVDCCSKTVLLV